MVDGVPRLSACLDRPVSELPGTELLVYCNRNVNPLLFSLAWQRSIPAASGQTEATEYVYQKYDNAEGASKSSLKKLSPDECRAIIAMRVGETLREHVPPGTNLVVGISGGGDSNALLHGFAQCRDVTISPVIIKGIPDWDSGVPRARALCETYGLDLTIIEEPEVRALLGIPASGPTLIERFEREFPGDDFEFLGTLLIRLALFQRARQLDTHYVCTGLNLEDVMCEAMFRIASGLAPAGFPVRQVGDMKLVLPLWLCPKRIIDGCFPRYSLDNYSGRYPCYSLGRNLYYSVVYSMQSQFPAFIEQMARGISTLAAREPVHYTFDEQLGFHVERFVPFALRERFSRLTRA
jgi:tRNA(Ile)-lysidine synthase TilS/MesJ